MLDEHQMEYGNVTVIFCACFILTADQCSVRSGSGGTELSPRTADGDEELPRLQAV